MNPTDPSSPSRPDIIARPNLALTDREKVCDELARQYAILEREKWQRMILTTFAYALCVIFAEPRVMVAFIVIDITAELLCLHFLRGLDPVATPGH